MKTDTGEPAGPAGRDDVERAHLKDPSDDSHTMHRYPPAADLAGFLRRFWVPVWSVPAGHEAPQRVLQYPVCLMAVTPTYARFYGVTSGMSTTTLAGDGWAVGVMLEPAAGALITGTTVAEHTDRACDLGEVLGPAAAALLERVRAAMAPDPRSPAAHRHAVEAVQDALRPYLPVDAEGELINEVVHFVEDDSDVTRVAQVCDRFALSERTLQRLVRRRVGVSPKWLIQRRRLHEAAEQLRTASMTVADVAALLGYADQAHLVRDFTRVAGITPGRFAARYGPR